jgi:hypothetical protein
MVYALTRVAISCSPKLSLTPPCYLGSREFLYSYTSLAESASSHGSFNMAKMWRYCPLFRL